MCICDDDLPRVDGSSFIVASVSALTSCSRGNHVFQYSTQLVQISCILVTWLKRLVASVAGCHAYNTCCIILLSLKAFDHALPSVN